MKTNCLLIVVLFSMISKFSSGQWEVDSLATDSWRGIYFTSADTGFICGYSGKIQKTIDGGKNWTMQNNVGGIVLRIHFPNPDTGYAIDQSNKTVLHSYDKGLTWAPVTLSAQALFDVKFVNGQIGYVVGAANGKAAIYKTINAGATWSLTSGQALAGYQAVSFANAGVGYAVGDDQSHNGLIAKTLDSGATWIEKVIPHPGTELYFMGVYFVNPDTGFIVGQNVNGSVQSCVVYKTTDGGATYTSKLIANDGGLNDVQFLDDNLGYTVGALFGPNGCGISIILKTINGGSTWNVENTGATIYGLRSFHFPDKYNGYAIEACTGPGKGQFLKYKTCPAAMPLVTQSNDTLFASAGYVSYQWYLSGNPINGAINSYYKPLQIDNYSLYVIDSSGCFAYLYSINYIMPFDCSNAGFEDGTTAGWVCQSGTYGSGILSGYCAPNVPKTCPEFPTNLTTTGIINTNGINAPLITGVDRHTIMTSSYLGTGMDSISHNTVPVVPPGGGTYSFRLGDGVAGGVGSNPNRVARAEAIKLSFLVTPSNTLFIYRYAVFLQDGGHLAEEQPRFDVRVTDSNDSIISGGYYHYVAGSSNPYCSGTRDTSTFKYGGTGLNANWRFTDWTDVCVDLSGYVGQNISVDFRTTDCFPRQSVTYSSNGVTTTCSNGICNWSLPTPGVTTVSTCTNAPGTHSTYAYIDTYCSIAPQVIKDTTICEGDSIILTVSGGANHNWYPAIGLNDPNSANPVASPTVTTTYFVGMNIGNGGCFVQDSVKVTVLTASTCITGLKKNNAAYPIFIHPNPSRGEFTVSGLQFAVNGTIDVYSALGEKVYSDAFNGKENTVNCKLNSGIYFVQVRDGERQWTQKIIIR